MLQVITGSHDKTVKLWDLRKGKAMTTLTYHKKSVRGLALHPTEYCFASASAENIKKFRLPRVSHLPPFPHNQSAAWLHACVDLHQDCIGGPSQPDLYNMRCNWFGERDKADTTAHLDTYHS